MSSNLVLSSVADNYCPGHLGNTIQHLQFASVVTLKSHHHSCFCIGLFPTGAVSLHSWCHSRGSVHVHWMELLLVLLELACPSLSHPLCFLMVLILPWILVCTCLLFSQQTSLFAHQLLLPLYRRFPGQVAAFVTLLLCVLSAGLRPHAAVLSLSLFLTWVVCLAWLSHQPGLPGIESGS